MKQYVRTTLALDMFLLVLRCCGTSLALDMFLLALRCCGTALKLEILNMEVLDGE